MRKEQIVEKLREIGLVPVLRAESEEQALGIASAIAAGGVTVLEITMTVPGAIRVMSRLTKERPDILIGAGTVLDAETARMCMLEGAHQVRGPGTVLILSANRSPEVTEYLDSGKIGVRPPGKVLRADAEVDYWEGEGIAEAVE